MVETVEGLQVGSSSVSKRLCSKLFSTATRSIGISRSSDVSVQLVRSLGVSVVAFAVDFGLLILLKEKAGLNYLVAATMSYCTGLVLNYWLSVKWVFAERKLNNKHAEFTIFSIISIIGLIINWFILVAFVQSMHIDYRVAKIAATVAVFFWNFLVRKKILY